jgi:predicted enzyme related to lactoylglutathione lyase
MDTQSPHTAVWFEIPSIEFNRAVKFYQDVMDVKLNEETMDGIQLGIFPHDNTSVSGAVVKGRDLKPNENGSIVYLNGGDDLAVPLSKVENAGGKVLFPKTLINDCVGYIAHFLDSEGNRVGIHSRN